MKIRWHKFDEPMDLDTSWVKGFDKKDEISAIYESLDYDNDESDDLVHRANVEKVERMHALMREEHEHADNAKYFTATYSANHLWDLINDTAKRGAHFRLSDGRQIGPVRNAETLFELAGDGAVLLEYGVEAEGDPRSEHFTVHDGSRRNFTLAAASKISKKKQKVTVLDANNKIAALAKIINDASKSQPIEVVPAKETLWNKIKAFFKK